MTNNTFEMKQYIFEWIGYVNVWALFFGVVIGVFDPVVGKGVVALAIGTSIMFGLGIMNDVCCGVITEEEWKTRRIM